MKNILKSLLIIVAVGFIATSCGEEPFDIKDGGSLGASMYPDGDIPFLFQTTTAVTVNLNPKANEGVTISGINVTKQLFTANGNSEAVTVQASGETFTQSSSEFFADVPVGGVVQSENTLSPGDNWVMSYTMTLSDGRTMSIVDKTKVTFQCVS